MNPRQLATLLAFTLAGEIAGTCPAWGGAFKCLQADGSIAYQESPCAAESQGTELQLDTRRPSGGKATGKGKDYSVEGQLKAIEAERRKALKGHDQADSGKRRTGKTANGPDRAKCAKERAEVARWRHKANAAYRDHDDKEFKERTLEYHQALVERYCRE